MNYVATGVKCPVFVCSSLSCCASTITLQYGELSISYIHIHVFVAGLYDTVFDVDHDVERAKAQGLEPNGFNFEGADSAGVDYALDR